MTPRVVGLDPSLTAYGIAHADGHTSTEGGGAAMRRRLPALRDAIESALVSNIDGGTAIRRVDLVVIEDLPTHAKSAGLTGQVQGITREVCTRYDIPFLTFAAASLKVFGADHGGADKRDMAMAYLLHAGTDDGLTEAQASDICHEGMRLPSTRYSYRGVGITKDGGEVDAWWLRQVGLAHLGEWDVPCTDRRRKSLAKVKRYDNEGRKDKS